jgi:L-aminopeptidase/D-esterase-like protein
MMNGTLTDVPGLKVGHWTNLEAGTGCTVIICPPGTVAGVDVRGSAPGTRETDLLDPINMVQQVDAVMLAGGSAYGLAAADGVMGWLEAHGRGLDVGVGRVPIVPGAVIFDLPFIRPDVRPDAAAGYAACEAAGDGPVAQGNVGAGTGATVGKLAGLNMATKGGLGSASRDLGGGLVVAALAVVNSVGAVYDPATGRAIAGPRDPDGGFFDTLELMAAIAGRSLASLRAGTNTTLALVATNAALTKSAATKVAQMAHDGLARAIRPVHTMYDGDTIFALSAGSETADVNLVGALAAELVTEAVLAGVNAAEPLGGLPAARDLARADPKGL